MLFDLLTLPFVRDGCEEADLAVGLKSTSTGAHGMTAAQVLRAAILKYPNCWPYRELELRISDSQMTKAFVKLDFDESYRTSSLQANIKRIRAETWEQISLTIVVDAVRELEVR